MGLFSGTLLSNNEEILYTFPIILLVLPSLNSLIGDISTVLISRLTSHLYLGTLSPKWFTYDNFIKPSCINKLRLLTWNSNWNRNCKSVVDNIYYNYYYFDPFRLDVCAIIY
jgi:hypothetical protein